MRRLTPATALLSMLVGLPQPAQQAPTAEAIDSLARAFLTGRVGVDVGSATLVVVQGEKILYLRSFGLAQPARNVAATPEGTVYQVGSNSKLFVATAAMQLVEQERLQLDRDINHYLKDMQVDGQGEPVTMAQLLTHTSGIEDRKLGRTQSLSEGPLETLGQFFRRYPPRRSVPGGSELNYSGNAMALAAHVVEQISGEPFDQYTTRHILIPLGMRRATFTQPLPDTLRAQRASMPNLPPLIAYPAGGLAMTTADMARFLIAQLNGGTVEGISILRPESVALMQEHHFPADRSIPGIGYGFFEAWLGGHRAVLHTGDYQHQSVLCLLPELKLGFFLVVNPIGELRQPLLTPFVTAFVDRFIPSVPRPEAQPAGAIPPETADGLVGHYRDAAIPRSTIERFFVGLLFGEGDARVTYDRSGKTLLFQPPDAEPVTLSWLGGTRFRTTDPRLGAELEFQVSHGRATGFFAGVGALGAYTFRRIPGILSQRLQFWFLLGSLALFSLWLPLVAVRTVRQRLARPPVDPATRAAERLPLGIITATALFGAGGFVLFSLLGLRIPSVALMTGVPAAFYALPLCFTAACIAALSLPWTLVRVWQRRTFGLGFRLLFTLTAASGIIFIPFCWYWRLLGLRI